VVRRVGALISQQSDAFATAISECTGKTKIDAIVTEVLPATLAARYYAREARWALRPYRPRRSSLLFANKVTTVYRAPLGVVGIISPWNYPLGIAIHELLQALLSGNGVLLKVATQVQPVGAALRDVLLEAGVPSGLVEVLFLSGRDASPALFDAGIDKLFFTGSTETGREIAAEAGRRLVPVNLELGGNDAMIVLEDADLKRAASCAVWAGMSNAGQSCGAIERILCVDRVYDQFMGYLREELKELRVGYGGVPGDIDVGSLTTNTQIDTVSRMVEQARGAGARVVQSGRFFTAEGAGQDTRNKSSRRSANPNGDTPSSNEPAAQSAADLVGEPRGGLFYPPTLIEEASEATEAMQEEIFGPVLAVRRVPREEEAVQLAAENPYGLTASVWTRDRSRGERVAARLPVGTVTVNDHLLSHGMPEAPWGGRKASGYGRSHGRSGFTEMTEERTVVHGRWERLFPRNLFWFPYSARLYSLVCSLARGPRLGTMLRALAQMRRRAGTSGGNRGGSGSRGGTGRSHRGNNGNAGGRTS
jgi:succinate-semialdehyde dehydrogenase/glutarate-semialdehyde dehydrogenase